MRKLCKLNLVVNVIIVLLFGVLKYFDNDILYLIFGLFIGCNVYISTGIYIKSKRIRRD